MRMKRSTALCLALAVAGLVPAAAAAGTHPSPYAGLESRPIKALSSEEIDGLLAGHGMGFAMAAELNDYPGPKHVLELASELGLTDEQSRATKAAFDAMSADAVALGGKLVESERELDALFAESQASDASLKAAVMRAEEIRGQLRYTHLRAHLSMKNILTPEQAVIYGKLRGYMDGSGHDPSMHHHHTGA